MGQCLLISDKYRRVKLTNTFGWVIKVHCMYLSHENDKMANLVATDKNSWKDLAVLKKILVLLSLTHTWCRSGGGCSCSSSCCCRWG